MSRITARIETITPAAAEKWLEDMVHNRKPKDATVACYANDMANGKWLLSPQGIAIDENGRLFDGQHRLLAIIRAGIAVDMLVIRGFPVMQKAMKTMDVLDSGAGRSISDRLRLMGAYHTNPNLTSAIARQIIQAVMGNTRASRKVSLSVVVEVCRLWKAEMMAVCTVLDRPQFRHARNGYIAAACTIAAAADPSRLDVDMGRILTGAGLEVGNPLLELRNLLMNRTEHTAPRDRTLLCLSAIYCTWHQIPGRAFMKLEHHDAAHQFFRTSQARRFNAVEKLFHSSST